MTSALSFVIIPAPLPLSGLNCPSCGFLPPLGEIVVLRHGDGVGGGEGIILIPGVCQAFYGCPVTYAVVWSGQTALHGTGRGGQSLQAGPSASAGDIYTAAS